MDINNNYRYCNPNFKQISITQNGKKALESNPFYYHLIKDSEIANKKLPKTKYWNLVIDGEKTYDKYQEKYKFNPVFKYISKITGELFKNLSINPPSCDRTHFHVCSSKKHKYLPSEVLLFSSNDLVTEKEKVKELAFDMKSYDEAEKYWDRFIDNNSKDIYVYEALEEISNKYESSLKIGIDEFLKTDPKFEKEMTKIARRDNYVWFADGSIDQWT